jgi:hypothetical protein
MATLFFSFLRKLLWGTPARAGGWAAQHLLEQLSSIEKGANLS